MIALTEGGINKILNIQSGMNQNFIVDVIKICKSMDNVKSFTIFDGKTKGKAFMQVSESRKDIHELAKKAGKQQLRIKIISHIVHKSNLNTCIQILDCQVVNNLTEIVESIQKLKTRQLKIQPIFKSKPISIKQEYVDKRSSQQTYKNTERYEQDTKQNENNQYNFKNYELISDLYQNCFAWELLARVIDSKYQQFTSKNGKPTIILAVELIDRVGYTITGKFFGQDAVARRNKIIKGKVYRVSKGKISEDKYVTKFSEKQSRYVITFGRVTQFLEMKDIPQIPHAPTNWLRLSQLPKLPSTDQTFNFVGILIEANQQVVMQRQPKPLTFQHFKIGDPITDLIYQCTIWNKQISLDLNLVGKSVLLTNVRVCLYKGQKTLATSFRSDLVPHSIFAKFNDNLAHFQVLEKKQPRLSTIRQIIQDSTESSVSGAIYFVEIWVSDIFLNQKWYYDSCPKCKKTCQPNSQCLNCSFDIKQPIKRFKLSIELSDQAGALKATAFQQSAPVFLNNTEISQILKMDIEELAQFGMKHCFGQYRIQLNAKKDENGRFSYAINGKPTPINFSDTATRKLKQAQDIITGKQKTK